MRASLWLLAPLLACGSSSTPRAPSNTAATPIVIATLAEDIAALQQVATDASKVPLPQRVSFLGWTAQHQAAYRVLLCAEDPLGGRGDYCDFTVCVVAPASGPQVPEASCESAAAFELYDTSGFDAATTTAAAEAAIATLGALTAGTPGSLDDAGLAIENGALVLARAGSSRRVIHAPDPDDEMPDLNAATSVLPDYVGASPDGACRIVLGRFTFRGWYEGVTGDVPRGFAVVTCD